MNSEQREREGEPRSGAEWASFPLRGKRERTLTAFVSRATLAPIKMSTTQYINLKDAALMIERSQQTVRRLIKGNCVKYRKYKTPQGFTYLVEKSSLLAHFNEMDDLNEAELVEEFDPLPDEDMFEPQGHAPMSTSKAAAATAPFTPTFVVSTTPPPPPPPSSTPLSANGFQTLVSELVRQHREDKNRLFELLETFQKRILILEEQLRQLEAPKTVSKRWYHFFRR